MAHSKKHEAAVAARKARQAEKLASALERQKAAAKRTALEQWNLLNARRMRALKERKRLLGKMKAHQRKVAMASAPDGVREAIVN